MALHVSSGEKDPNGICLIKTIFVYIPCGQYEYPYLSPPQSQRECLNIQYCEFVVGRISNPLLLDFGFLTI